MHRLRRVLAHRVSVAALFEAALWLALPYLVIGIVFTFVQPEFVYVAQDDLQTRIPAGADLVAFGESVLYWPVLLLTPENCLA